MQLQIDDLPTTRASMDGVDSFRKTRYLDSLFADKQKTVASAIALANASTLPCKKPIHTNVMLSRSLQPNQLRALNVSGSNSIVAKLYSFN